MQIDTATHAVFVVGTRRCVQLWRGPVGAGNGAGALGRGLRHAGGYCSAVRTRVSNAMRRHSNACARSLWKTAVSAHPGQCSRQGDRTRDNHLFTVLPALPMCGANI